jgi:hypothetical protein
MDGFKSLMENTIKMDDLGVPLAFETSIYIYIFSLEIDPSPLRIAFVFDPPSC